MKGRKRFDIQFIDELGNPRTDLTSVTITTAAGGEATVYTTQIGTVERGSSGVIEDGLSDGRIEFWYEGTSVNISATNGTYVITQTGFGVTEHNIRFPKAFMSEA